MSQAAKPLRPRLGSAIKRLQLALRVAADVVLAELGLSMAQYAALEVLIEHERLPCAELARHCSITRQSMQDVVRALHAQGFIRKDVDPDHGRHVIVTVTALGRKAARVAGNSIAGVEAQMTQGLTPREQTQLLGWVNACVGNLRSDKTG